MAPMTEMTVNHYRPSTINVHVPIQNKDTARHLTDRREKLIDASIKLNYQLLEAFKLMFNLKINYKIDYCNNTTDFDSFEVRNDAELNAIFTSCVLHNLKTGKYDISLYPILLTTITSKTLESFDLPGFSERLTSKWIFLEPKLSAIMNVYTLPFTNGVWLAILGVVLVVIIFLWLISKWQVFLFIRNNKINNTMNKNEENNEISSNLNVALSLENSLIDVAFLAFGAISQQGVDKEPHGFHGKTITWCLFLLFMFLYAAYSASIVALLQATSGDITALRNLWESPLNLGVHDSYLLRNALPEVKGEERLKLLEKSGTMKEKSMNFDKFMSKDQGVVKIRERMFAFLIEANIGYTLIEETFDEVEKCTLQELPLLQFPTDFYFIIKKRSKFYELLKRGFLKLRETGIHHRELRLFHTPKPQCWTLDTNFESVGISDCYFAVALFCGGAILSLVIFLGELANFKVRKTLLG